MFYLYSSLFRIVNISIALRNDFFWPGALAMSSGGAWRGGRKDSI